VTIALACRRAIAQGGRILYAKGVVDAFGHVSARHPDRTDRFLMARSMAPALVTLDDVIEHDLDGEPMSEPGARVFLERFIHAEIYRARPDVYAIVHSHAPTVVPFTVVDTPVRPIAHTCGFLRSVGRPFDTADHAGDGSDLLVRDAGLGKALAAHLANACVVLMRGHGFTAVGGSVAEAVFRAVYTALNCQLLATALQLGEPRGLSVAEAEACERSTTSQIDRAWSLWLSEHGES
jgi:HCOMODA/2-hydroxy-3-carboxy-muconic semialdehyde decarboxylase